MLCSIICTALYCTVLYCMRHCAEHRSGCSHYSLTRLSTKMEECKSELDLIVTIDAAERFLIENHKDKIFYRSDDDVWLTIQNRRFDLTLFEDETPYQAFHLLLNTASNVFIRRVFNREFHRGEFASIGDLDAIIESSFDGMLPCLGYFGYDEDFDLEGGFLGFETAKFPCDRIISNACEFAYSRDGKRPLTELEKKGVGLCSSCRGMQERVKSEEPGLKAENAVTEPDVVDFEGELRVEEPDFNKRERKRPKRGKKRKHQVDDDNDNDSHREVKETRSPVGFPKKCDEEGCDATLNTLYSLYNHRTNKHFYGTFACSACDFSSTKATVLYQHHAEEHEDDDEFRCPNCKTSTFNPKTGVLEEFSAHYLECVKMALREQQKKRFRRAVAEKRHHCDKCGKSFHAPSTLRHHLNQHEGIYLYQCDECGYRTNRASVFKTHKQKHLVDKGIKEDAETGEKFLKECKECGKGYLDNTQLKHVEREHSEGNVICETCGEVFTCQRYLKKHELRVHPKDPNLICKVCGYVAVMQSGLKQHMRKHEEGKFICRFCGKALKSKVTLAGHESQHTGENRFKCEICGFTCGYSTVLYNHQVWKHGRPKVGGVRHEGTKIPLNQLAEMFPQETESGANVVNDS